MSLRRALQELSHNDCRKAVITVFKIFVGMLPRPTQEGGVKGDLVNLQLLSPQRPALQLPAPEVLARAIINSPDAGMTAQEKDAVRDVYLAYGAGLQFIFYIPEVIFRSAMLTFEPAQVLAMLGLH